MKWIKPSKLQFNLHKVLLLVGPDSTSGSGISLMLNEATLLLKDQRYSLGKLLDPRAATSNFGVWGKQHKTHPILFSPHSPLLPPPPAHSMSTVVLPCSVNLSVLWLPADSITAMAICGAAFEKFSSWLKSSSFFPIAPSCFLNPIQRDGDDL